MNNILKKYGGWVAALLAVLLLLVFYGKYVISPDSYLFSGGGDGIKNYYTFAWHIQYDSTAAHFGGMNYPYGEHTVFTDNQPLLSIPLQWVHRNIFPVGNYAIGITNLLMFLGVVLAVIYLYKLFNAFTDNRTFSVFAAAAVGFLSPQMHRITEHFALAYCFVLPFFIWLLYKFFKEPSWQKSIGIGVAMLALLYIHLYYILIVGGLIMALWLVFLIHKLTVKLPKALLHMAVQVIIPLGIYFVWLKLTDTVADRPSEPYGLSEFAARWQGLFFPLGFEYFKPIEKALHIRNVSSESYSYAGLPVFIFLVACLYIWVKNRFIKNKIKKEPPPRTFESIFLTALLIAAGLVFVYAAFSPLLLKIPVVSKYLELLKQFRSLGRLLWVSYYALNIFVFVYVFNRYKNHPKLKTLPYVLLLLLFAEGAIWNISIAKKLDLPRPGQPWVPATVNASNYRAIIPLPFFHEGSENLNITTPNNFIVEQSLLLSWQTGIPLHAVKMSRTSISQTLAQAEMGLEFTTNPALLSNDTTRPYLFIVDEKTAEYLPEIKQEAPIAQNGNIRLYSITKNKLEDFLRSRAALYKTQPSTRQVIRTSFPATTGQPFMELGSIAVNPQKTVTLYDGPCAFCSDSVTVSFWLYANMEGLAQPKLHMTYGGEKHKFQVMSGIKAVSRQWALVEFTFLPQSDSIKVEVLKETEAQKEPMYVAELLLRPAKQDYIRQSNGFLVKNNRYYSLPPQN